MSPELMFIAILGAHFFLDFDQGEFMARGKNRDDPFTGVSFRWPLSAHAFIHGSAVALITQIWWLLIPEFIIHWITDDLKCQNKLSFNEDQTIHICCKLLWFGIWVISTMH